MSAGQVQGKRSDSHDLNAASDDSGSSRSDEAATGRILADGQAERLVDFGNRSIRARARVPQRP
jgi:hypothetical protein